MLWIWPVNTFLLIVWGVLQQLGDENWANLINDKLQ